MNISFYREGTTRQRGQSVTFWGLVSGSLTSENCVRFGNDHRFELLRGLNAVTEERSVDQPGTGTSCDLP